MKPNRIDFRAINQAALPVLPVILSRLFPSGRREGHDFVALNPHRADKRLGSFRICISGAKAGVWSDFSTHDKGGDPISLIAFLEGEPMGDAARRLAKMIGVTEGRR